MEAEEQPIRPDERRATVHSARQRGVLVPATLADLLEAAALLYQRVRVDRVLWALGARR